jgi:hypothetical protein
MSVRHDNESDHIRRNPQDSQGKLRGGGGDLIGDEEMQVDEWEELIAEEQGEFDSRIDDVGNAESAMLGGTEPTTSVRATSQSAKPPLKIAPMSAALTDRSATAAGRNGHAQSTTE